MTSNPADLKLLVHPGDLLAAVKTKFGPTASIINYEVELGTETLQGFASLILRVAAKVRVNDFENVDARFIVKRKPAYAAHAEMMGGLGDIGLRESKYFNEILPILEEKAGQLPVVRALVSHKDAIVMEDLCESGFETVSKTMTDIGRGKALTLPIARVVARKLAKLHAASLGRNWLETEAEMFESDPIFDGPQKEIFKGMVMNAFLNIIIPIIDEFFGDVPILKKVVDFTNGPRYFETVAEVIKDKSFRQNVVLHGDCWLNNFMFKIDPETEKVIDMRFIDLQIVRFGSPAKDLLYFLYSSSSLEFREKYEREILKTYVEAFNAEANETPDLLQFEDLVQDYEKSRIFGIFIAMGLRPVQFLTLFAPPSGGGLDNDFLEQVKDPSKWAEPAKKQFREDDIVKKEFTDLIHHSIDVLKQYIDVEE
ncbi:uncharacterized protein LOC132203987 [Neocloeon triangulifer]|uniref:uncharacterized protein LOC132203987 n=1 Tax=Neocloeon triangulifer TaxID=2078957 RepID=UPI00286F2B7B|nr:uncharacterized protein LOC132203987 [Neocloeon triangulifer]